MKRLLRKVVYAIPHTQALWVELNRALGREGRPEFSGWGMVTEARPPWQDGNGDRLARDFTEVNADVVARVAALEVMFERMLPGAVALFDDYGWPGFQDTKLRVDQFFHARRGILLPLPTGQAMFFKH